MAQIEKAREQLVAAHREAEEKLRESEGRYQALMDQLRALDSLRAEVWRMRQVKDILQVLSPIGAILTSREVSFLAYSINVVDDPGGEFPVRVYIHDPAGRQFQASLKRDQAETHIILEAWKTGKVLYRPDLARENIYGEHLQPQPHHLQVCSAIDIPFSYGTLALASARPEAFSKRDIAFFEDIAQVVEEGFHRVEDLQHLEQRTQALEEEIAEHKRTEEALRRAEEDLKVDLALQRVRNTVLQMEDEQGWGEVVGVFGKELDQVVPFYHCGINFVDLERHRVRCFMVRGEGLYRETNEDTGEVSRVFKAVLETGKSLYRPRRTDPLFDPDIPAEVNSVVDVPFARGTVAINRTGEDAFSARDIQILERFAQALSEAHRRLEDLNALALREQQLAQFQKLEAVGQLATGVAHEINNPLTAVVGYSELMLRKELDPQMRQRLEVIYQEGLRAAWIIKQLLNFSRRQRADKQRAELNPLVEELLVLVRQQFALDQVQLSAELAENLPLVEVHPGQFQQVVLGLLHNSREVILQAHKEGKVTVRTCQLGEWVRLEVEDDGPGIPAELRERIFEPFFTTKEVGKGPGLGLSICHTIAREHGGRLWAAPREKGACLVLELPVNSASSSATG